MAPSPLSILQLRILEYLVNEAPDRVATKRMIGTAIFGAQEFVADKVWPDCKALEEMGLISRMNVLHNAVYSPTDKGYEYIRTR